MVVGLICALTFLSNMSMSLMAPFYPLEVKEHGIPVVYVGFVLGTAAGTFIITCLVTGKLLDRYSRETLVIVSMILLVSAVYA